MDIQQILDSRFVSPEQAIAAYGSNVIKLAFAEYTPIRPLPCNFKDDMVVPRVESIKTTIIELRLFRFSDGYYRFVNMGEV